MITIAMFGKVRRPAIPAIAKRGADRELLPVEGMSQDRGFAFRRPGAADRGALGDPAFVLENEPGMEATGFFLSAGQRSAIHWRTC